MTKKWTPKNATDAAEEGRREATRLEQIDREDSQLLWEQWERLDEPSEPARQPTLRERLARMSWEEIVEAARVTAERDRQLKDAGLLNVVDDREEALQIGLERLPVLEEIARKNKLD